MDCIIHIKHKAITNKPVIIKFFGELNDGKYLITAKNINRRTLPQNAYLHGIVIPLVFEGLRNAGYNDVRDHEDAKTVIKTLFLKRKIRNEKTDEVIEIVRRTRDLTTIEMINFIDEVVMWAGEYLMVVIPGPGEPMPLFSKPLLCHYDITNDITIVQ